MAGIAGNRPLLRETVGPVLAVPETDKRTDVLYNSKLLIVGLFDQEAIVLDAADLRGLIIVRNLRIGSERCRKQEDDDAEIETNHNWILFEIEFQFQN